MKLTNRQLVSSIEALGDLLKLRLPVKTSFRVAKTVKKVNSVLEDYNKTLEKIKTDHAKKDDDGNPELIDGNKLVFEDVSEFETAVNELLDLETDLDITKLKLKDFGKVEVSPGVILSVDWLIEE